MFTIAPQPANLAGIVSFLVAIDPAAPSESIISRHRRWPQHRCWVWKFLRTTRTFCIFPSPKSLWSFAAPLCCGGTAPSEQHPRPQPSGPDDAHISRSPKQQFFVTSEQERCDSDIPPFTSIGFVWSSTKFTHHIGRIFHPINIGNHERSTTRIAGTCSSRPSDFDPLTVDRSVEYVRTWNVKNVHVFSASKWKWSTSEEVHLSELCSVEEAAPYTALHWTWIKSTRT